MRAFRPFLVAIIITVGVGNVLPASLQQPHAEHVATPDGYASTHVNVSLRVDGGRVPDGDTSEWSPVSSLSSAPSQPR